MTNSTNNRIRKYVAGGFLAVAAVFGGALGSAGVGFADPADGWDPIAPAVEAPAPALRAPAASAAPAHKAPGQASPRSAGKDHKGGSDHGRSSKGRSH